MAATAIRSPRIEVLRAGGTGRFAADVRDSLSRTPKQLPSQYFYDPIGSALFTAICELPWYGITRAETRLLTQYGGEILERVRDLQSVAELGPGNGAKLAALLVARPAIAQHVRVDLIDVSRAALDAATATLAAHGVLRVVGHETTYDDGLERLARIPATGARLILLLGSNLGNFEPAAADAMLRRIWQCTRPGDALLVGLDLVKTEGDLIRAYDDPIGVTAAFNRNLLARINRELRGTFDLAAFAHQARWNGAAGRVEMHLVSTRAQTARIPLADLDVSLAAGETIWTESSYKYDVDELDQLLAGAGFAPAARWIDAHARFALMLGIRPLDVDTTRRSHPEDPMAHEHITPEMRRCIDECNSCHDICTECTTHCLTLGGKHAEADHIQTMIDCADLCAASADFMLRGSELHTEVCGVCAEACERCAESCGEMADDDMMQRCALECRRCADSCRQMAGVEAR